jgi:hypothetical protein
MEGIVYNDFWKRKEYANRAQLGRKRYPKGGDFSAKLSADGYWR